jgi:hypothetical protein
MTAFGLAVLSRANVWIAAENYTFHGRKIISAIVSQQSVPLPVLILTLSSWDCGMAAAPKVVTLI